MLKGGTILLIIILIFIPTSVCCGCGRLGEIRGQVPVCCRVHTETNSHSRSLSQLQFFIPSRILQWLQPLIRHVLYRLMAGSYLIQLIQVSLSEQKEYRCNRLSFKDYYYLGWAQQQISFSHSLE